MKFIKIFFIFLLPLLLLSCTAHIENQSISEQGISGYIEFLEGNFMPIALSSNTGTITPVSKTVYIYEKTTKDMAEKSETGYSFYSKINSKLVATTKSDDSGTFKVLLPPGSYSIFIKEKGLYYATHDIHRILAPIQVTENSFTEITLSISYLAYY
jgi:hypothetical protein